MLLDVSSTSAGSRKSSTVDLNQAMGVPSEYARVQHISPYRAGDHLSSGRPNRGSAIDLLMLVHGCMRTVDNPRMQTLCEAVTALSNSIRLFHSFVQIVLCAGFELTASSPLVT